MKGKWDIWDIMIDEEGKERSETFEGGIGGPVEGMGTQGHQTEGN